MLDDSALFVPPFDLLSAAERARLYESTEQVEFAAGTTLLSPETEASDAWLLVDGNVQETEAGQPVAEHEPHRLLAVRAVLAGRSGSALTARDKVTALRVPKAVLQALLACNAAFAAAIFGDLARRLSQPAERREHRQLVSLLASRVRDACVRKPFFVDGAQDVVSVCRLLAENDSTSALVRDGDRVGMFTTTDLRDALLRSEPVATLPVRELAHFELVAVAADDELFEALLLMLRHRVHRVLVRDGDEIVGVLGQLDLMSFVSNHSHLIWLQARQASSVAELRAAALQVDELIELLHGDGVRVEVICGLVRELNGRILARLWSLLAPQALRENSCLIVMGSEGRGEQIVKTDQDNALLLRDGFEFEALAEVTERYTAALTGFGYPLCPGGIMLSRPLWRQSLAGFRKCLREWILGADPEGPMNLAIFLDARAIAGDHSLLAQARDHVDRVLVDNDAFLARFVSAIDQFDDSGGWWSRLTSLRAREDTEVDLKKLGIFPIVHGVRALSLQYRVRAYASAERLRILVGQGRIDEALARDLIEALNFLIALKLKTNLRQRQHGRPADNRLDTARLGTLERDALKDSLAIVRRFRQWLHRHYRLDSL